MGGRVKINVTGRMPHATTHQFQRKILDVLAGVGGKGEVDNIFHRTESEGAGKKDGLSEGIRRAGK